MTFACRLVLGAVLLFASCRILCAQEYFTVDEIDKAKVAAHARHLPIAWLSSHTRYLGPGYSNFAPDSDVTLTQLAISTLQGMAVIIFQNGDDDLPRMPQNMVDRIETKDEGDIPGGGHYTAPKIIYLDPDLKTFLGCTLAPDLRANGESAITTALLHIKHDSQAEALIDDAGKANAPSAVTAASAGAPAEAAALSISTSTDSFFFFGIAGLFVVVFVVAFFILRNRE